MVIMVSMALVWCHGAGVVFMVLVESWCSQWWWTYSVFDSRRGMVSEDYGRDGIMVFDDYGDVGNGF